MIRGVIFDIDGVILDSMGVWNDLGERYLKSKGIKAEASLGEILFSMSMEEGAVYLKEHYPLSECPDKILEEIQKMIEDFYYYEVQCKEGVVELLNFLKERNISIVAATSSPRNHIEKALERNCVLDYFKAIYTTSEVGESKHSPKTYDISAQYLNLKKEEIVVFEDSLYALETAKTAGYSVVGVYDAQGESNQKKMKEVSDIYVLSYKDFLKDGGTLFGNKLL